MARLATFVSLACLYATAAAAQVANDDAAICRNTVGEPAIAACGRLIFAGKLNPRELAVMHNRRGFELERKGDDEGALKDYNEALRLDLKFALVFVNRAAIFRKKADLDAAIADYTNAIRLNPKLLPAFNGRGVVFNDKREHDQAIADFSEAIRLDPRFALAYVNRGFAYRAKGDFDHAIADYDEAIRIDPKPAGYYLNRGLAWRGKGDIERAITDFTDAIRINGNFALAYRERGYAYAAKDDKDSAIADLSAAIRLNSNNAPAYIARSRAYASKGDYAQSVADAELAIALNPNSAPAHNLRGFALKQIGDLEHAMPEFDEAIRLAPNLASAYANRGDAYRRKGDTDRAIADLNTSIRLDARQTQAYTNRGLAYQATGKLDLARADFTTATGRPQSRSIAAKDAVETARARLTALGPSAPQPADIGKPATGLVLGEKRVALVIGNSAYRSVPALPNASRDAGAVAAALRGVGFQTVDLAADLPKEKLIAALHSFARLAEQADWALIYYAGHGMEIGGLNYLIPTDAKLETDRDVQFEALPLDQVLATVEPARKLRIVLLDACRENPFASQMRRTIATRSVGRGLARVEPEGGTLVGFAAKHGEVALDGDGNNSPFATAFVKRVGVPGVEISKLFRLIRDDVLGATGGKQEPFVYGSLPGDDFYFSPPIVENRR